MVLLRIPVNLGRLTISLHNMFFIRSFKFHLLSLIQTSISLTAFLILNISSFLLAFKWQDENVEQMLQKQHRKSFLRMFFSALWCFHLVNVFQWKFSSAAFIGKLYYFLKWGKIVFCFLFCVKVCFSSFQMVVECFIRRKFSSFLFVMKMILSFSGLSLVFNDFGLLSYTSIYRN